MTMIDTKKLDTLLCEALEIAPIVEICECGGNLWELALPDDDAQLCHLCPKFRVAQREYPELSTSGNGMLLLMQALRRRDMVWFTEFCGDQIFACVFKPEPDGEPMTQYGDEEPITLALAAAQALGIEVPR